jgi:hypothetical protein
MQPERNCAGAYDGCALADLYQNHERFEKTYFEPFKVRRHLQRSIDVQDDCAVLLLMLRGHHKRNCVLRAGLLLCG